MRAERPTVIIGGLALSLGFILLAAILFWTLLPACGARPLFGPLFGDFCPEPARPAVSDRLRVAQESRSELKIEIAALERRLALIRCEQPVRTQPPPERASETCWRIDSDYAVRDERSSREIPVESWEVCVDDEGRGRQRLVFEGGVSCAGEAQVEVSSTTVAINDVGDVACDNGFRISERRTTCRIGSDGRAICRQSQEAQEGDQWPVSLDQ
ncbi:MAG: hypothetical protein AAGM38_17075 [Pseudomonadota bacterium]